MIKNHQNGSSIVNASVSGSVSSGLKTDKDGFLLTHIAKPLSPYDEILTYSRNSVVQVEYTYGINSEVVNIQEVLGGTVTWGLDGSLDLVSGTDPAGKSVLTSIQFIKQQSDQTIDFYATCSITPPTANHIFEVGTGDSVDGTFFGQDSNGLYVFTRNNSVDTKYRREDWNGDRLDGLGGSKMVLDSTKLNIYRIEYLNNCCFVFSVKNMLTNEWNNCHRIIVNNKLENLPLRISNNFICIISRNTGTTTGGTLKLTNMSAFDSGKMKINGPLRSQVSTKTVTTLVPILSFMNKTTFVGIPNKLTSFLQLISAATDGTKNVIIKIIENGILVGDSFVDFDTNNSPIQYDTSATSLSGGRVIFTFTLERVASLLIDLSKYNIKMLPGGIITVEAESVNANDVSISLTERSDL